MERRDLTNALLCAALMLAAIALCIPLGECGVNDDWSYTKTALDLANTGHLVYNGWAAAMLGAQAYWGALWIKLFGFSFLVVRLSTAPLAAGCAALLYALHRRAGLPPRLAVFGTAMVTLFPVFLPLAATFMTEIPGQFLLLLSIYGYSRAAEIIDRSPSDHEMDQRERTRLWTWLLLALVAGLFGGTVRQVIWIVPFATPLYLLWRNRAFRRVRASLLPLTVSALIGFAGAIRMSAWYDSQPYAIHERTIYAFLVLANWHSYQYLGTEAVRMGLTIAMGLLPILLALPVALVALVRRQPAPPVALAAIPLIAVGLFGIEYLALTGAWVMPWMWNTFDIRPYLAGTIPMPVLPKDPVLPMAVWYLLSALIIALTNLAIAQVIVFTATRRFAKNRPAEDTPQRTPTPIPLQLLLLFTLAYAPLVLLKVLVPMDFGVLDRYLLPLLPAASIIALLHWHRATGRESAPIASWVVLAFYAYYGIAQTHDYFAELRAGKTLTDTLESRGVPRNHIMGGFAYDGWTQITEAGHYNDARIELPKNAYTPPKPSLGFTTVYSFWTYTPVVEPDYVLVAARHPDLIDTDLPSAAYSCWLPPFHRTLGLQTTDPAHATSTPP